MRRPVLAVLIFAAALVISTASRAADDEVTAEQVRTAIERAVEFLKREQHPDGTWNNRVGYGGGLTPLCTLALLHAGCEVEDEAVAKALTHLRAFQPQATYATALQTMVFSAAEPKKDALLILRNVRWLENHQIKEGELAGMWAVPVPSTHDHTDNSMTHLAMIALYDAERAGVQASEATWRLALDYWRRSQNADGSWGWGPGYPGTGSMTCAGIAAILISEARLGEGDATVVGDQVQCCGQQESNSHVERGLAWLKQHYSVVRNPGATYWLSYYLYSLERACRLTVRRHIGDHDWYRDGARMLVATQLTSGTWPSDLDAEDESDPSIQCSFDLMFLAKARRPVVLAQVRHAADDWNPHRAALFQLVAHAEKTWDHELTHQVVDLSAAKVEDLLETPILYLSGRDAPQLSADDKQKLRQYVDRGGFIFAVQTCTGGTFDTWFRELMSELFPEPDAVLRPLVEGHPIWYLDERVAPDQNFELWGIETGCRTSVVYCPQDLSCYWELARPDRLTTYSPRVQASIRAARSIGLNVLAYATGREVSYRDPGSPTPRPHDAPRDDARGTLHVANVMHPGGCRVAPTALENLLRLAADTLKLPTADAPHEVSLTDDDLFDYHLVTFHGRTGFQLTDAERKQLRAYLERGGVIFADAICSSPAFVESFRRELKLVLPDHPLEPIPADDPLFSDQYGGAKIDRVARRLGPSQPGSEPGEEVVHEAPLFEGLKLDDRFAVIFSPYDVSCALESHGTPGCPGYANRDAARLALNVLLYSLH